LADLKATLQRERAERTAWLSRQRENDAADQEEEVPKPKSKMPDRPESEKKEVSVAKKQLSTMRAESDDEKKKLAKGADKKVKLENQSDDKKNDDEPAPKTKKKKDGLKGKDDKPNEEGEKDKDMVHAKNKGKKSEKGKEKDKGEEMKGKEKDAAEKGEPTTKRVRKRKQSVSEESHSEPRKGKKRNVSTAGSAKKITKVSQERRMAEMDALEEQIKTRERLLKLHDKKKAMEHRRAVAAGESTGSPNDGVPEGRYKGNGKRAVLRTAHSVAKDRIVVNRHLDADPRNRVRYVDSSAARSPFDDGAEHRRMIMRNQVEKFLRINNLSKRCAQALLEASPFIQHKVLEYLGPKLPHQSMNARTDIVLTTLARMEEEAKPTLIESPIPMERARERRVPAASANKRSTERHRRRASF